MFPGSVSKFSSATIASATSIKAKTDVIRLTGAVQIDTIVPAFGKQFCQMVVLIPVASAIVLGTGGNIAVGLTAAINRALMLVYEPSADKWYLESGV